MQWILENQDVCRSDSSFETEQKEDVVEKHQSWIHMPATAAGGAEGWTVHVHLQPDAAFRSTKRKWCAQPASLANEMWPHREEGSMKMTEWQVWVWKQRERSCDLSSYHPVCPALSVKYDHVINAVKTLSHQPLSTSLTWFWGRTPRVKNYFYTVTQTRMNCNDTDPHLLFCSPARFISNTMDSEIWAMTINLSENHW